MTVGGDVALSVTIWYGRLWAASIPQLVISPVVGAAFSGKTQLLPSLWSKSRWLESASTIGSTTCSPTSHRIPKSARRLRTSRFRPYLRSLMSGLAESGGGCTSRLTNELSVWCSHCSDRLKSKRLSSSSADTTRVTSAAPATDPSRVELSKTAQDVFLMVAALKEVGATITQTPRSSLRLTPEPSKGSAPPAMTPTGEARRSPTRYGGRAPSSSSADSCARS